jgi:hypothetical protein
VYDDSDDVDPDTWDDIEDEMDDPWMRHPPPGECSALLLHCAALIASFAPFCGACAHVTWLPALQPSGKLHSCS